MEFLKFAVFLSLISVSFAHEPLNSHLLPRPLIIEYPETLGTRSAPDDEIRLQCTSWRVAVEANNVSPWKTIPEECADYVKEYMAGRGYGVDLERVSSEALSFARSVEVQEDGRDVWIFDIDETLLSNLPYYAEHGYGLEVFDNLQFDKWVETGKAAAIGPSLRLYEEVCGLGFKVFLMTGRGEKMRCVTVENLKDAGFQKWDRLMLR
uniref:Acid phosphatase n=1 Tax=Kalanchoe fedtschenkoi TaxID=63787 RepID=A0A7N0RDG4_KALFE